MLVRPKAFLVLCLACLAPLVLLSLIGLRNAVGASEAVLRAGISDDLKTASLGFSNLVAARRQELATIARGPMRDYLNAPPSVDVTMVPSAAPLAISGPSPKPGPPAIDSRISDPVLGLLTSSRDYAAIAGFSPSRRQVFLAETSAASGAVFRTSDLLAGQISPENSVWTVRDETTLCMIIPNPTLGEVLRCSLPVFPHAAGASSRAALVADFRLDSLFSEVMPQGDANASVEASRIMVVLDHSGNIVFHPNDALKHQVAAMAMPYFASTASRMVAGESGSAFFVAPEKDQWLAAFAPLELSGHSLAVARNYSAATRSARRGSMLGISLALVLGLMAALMLGILYERKLRGIEQVKVGVAAIAGGKLDEQLLVRSQDDLRPIADSVNLMTERLREQIARESESKQFASFLRISAMLTHDLKNAIEALSLTVSNMDRHFDSQEFRADAMKSLTGATNKLRSLVSRLSNPIQTLSGEFKKPRPTDLVPLLKRVLEQTAEPMSDTHQIETDLPPSLFAMVDAERIEKVIENLVLNALESMATRNGTLRVTAGPDGDGKVFFSVSDTGIGMRAEFIRERLFRPFATTKKRGVGLGLYTCREVVRANGGSITVDSTEGSGTTFRVVLASAAIGSRD